MAIIDSGKINIVVDIPNRLKEVEEKLVENIKTEINKSNKRPLPFECEIYDKKPVEITNPIMGSSCFLEPDAVAVYDSIKGAELLGEHDIVRKGCDWFRKYFPKEYMILLD